MTTPNERLRNLVQAGAFLRRIGADNSLPVSVCREAGRLLRHYPTLDELRMLSRSCDMLASEIDPSWLERGLQEREMERDGAFDAKADLSQVLLVVDEISGEREASLKWLQQPLGVFNGRTPEELISIGRADDLIGYLHSISSGYVG